MGAIFKIFGISDSPIFAMEMNDSRMGFLPAPLHPLRERIPPHKYQIQPLIFVRLIE